MNIGFISCFEPEYFPNFQTFPYRSERSLLDFDLVLWHLEFLHFDYRIRIEEEPHDLAKLLEDRKRRLREIDTFLEQGKSLVLLLADPVRMQITNPFLCDVELVESMSKRKVGRKALEQIRKKGERIIKEQDQILSNHSLSRDNLDIYSFLPDYIEQPLRKYCAPANSRSNEIDFRGDLAFLDFWNCLKGKAWYDVFFSSPVGNPLLYSSGTQYSVSTWLKHSKGNIILLPNTEYDTSDDYPLFVEATKHLLSAFGNLTNNHIEIPWKRQQNHVPSWYIDPSRLDELKDLSNQYFDMTKLIKLCEEVNICYSNDCFFAVTMLVRTIINHVPPIFGYQTFSEVANNYGGGSFKKSMQNLYNSLKNIADANLHLPVRKKESLPTKVQVNFCHDLDILLSEVIRVLKEIYPPTDELHSHNPYKAKHDQPPHEG